MLTEAMMNDKLKAIGTALVIAGIFSIAYNFFVIEIQLNINSYTPKAGESPPIVSVKFWQPYILAGISFLGVGITIFVILIFCNLETEAKSRGYGDTYASNKT